MARLDFLNGLDSTRLQRMLCEAVDRLELDLTGALLLTEAGSGAYALTPLLAAMAGAQVYALTEDSNYASAQEVSSQVSTIADSTRIGMDKIRITKERKSLPAGFDIITNLGFVRPIDASLLDVLSSKGCVSYMCEAWEYRSGDLDLDECDRRHIPVAGVWEDFEELNVFRSCGQLAVKLCFEAGLEVVGNHFVVISADRFGPVIASALEANLATVRLVSDASELTETLIANTDAIIVADYSSERSILDQRTAKEVAHWNPGLVIIQFAGRNDLAALIEAKLQVFPARQSLQRRMTFTLSHLGVRPALLLHAAGLKVGEMLWRARCGEIVSERFRLLAQPMNESARTLVSQ